MGKEIISRFHYPVKNYVYCSVLLKWGDKIIIVMNA